MAKKVKRHPTKGQKEEAAKRQFLIHGLDRDEKTRSGHGGDIWWRDRVMFTEHHPAWRIVDLPKMNSAGQQQAVLIKYLSLGEHSYPGVSGRFVILPVPDIAVFSRYEGDMLDDAGLSHRIRFIYMRQFQWHVEKTAAKFNGAQLYNNGNHAEHLRQQLDNMLENYHRYEYNLKPGWPPLAIDWRVKLDELITEKVGAYRDPSAIKARERAAARKTAVSALGLDQSEAA